MEVASGGTLFLDEIGNLSIHAQTKLLTTIEKRLITRVGSTKERNIDVRIISATNADLQSMVEKGIFRQDLMYRINTIEIHIPPLRERGDDVILLAEFFLEKYASKYNKKIKGISRDAKIMLTRYGWPGNVRELQHAVERAVIMEENTIIKPYSLMIPQKDKNSSNAPLPLGEMTMNLEELERDAIERAMKRANGNISHAAELLGITRYSLYRKLGKQ